MTILSRREAPLGTYGDRRPELYGSLITFLIINNILIASRFYVYLRAHYKARRSILAEDIFALLSAVGELETAISVRPLLTFYKCCVNVVIGNLLACVFAFSLVCKKAFCVLTRCLSYPLWTRSTCNRHQCA